jgi:hypothetical protein
VGLAAVIKHKPGKPSWPGTGWCPVPLASRRWRVGLAAVIKHKPGEPSWPGSPPHRPASPSHWAQAAKVMKLTTQNTEGVAWVK